MKLMTKTNMHPAQQDIFADQIINIDSPHYNLGLYINIYGALNIPEFKKAVSSSPEVFDVFKMRFDSNEPEAVCYIDKEFCKLELAELDVSNTDNPLESANEWMQNQFNVAIPLEKGRVLTEVCLLKIADKHHCFFFKFHHLIIDAYGFVVWLNYISKKYCCLINNIDKTFSYPSYLTEVTNAIGYYNSPAYKLAENYWKNKVKEKPENLLHKKYRIYNANDRLSGNYYIELDEELREVFAALQTATGSNPQQVLIAAMLIYYAKVSGEKEIALGIPFHKRGHDGQRNIVGMFSGILPFIDKVNSETILNELLSQIKNVIKEDFKFRNYLISDLSRNLKTNITNSYLCDVVVNYVPFNFTLDFGEEITTDIHWLLSEFERTGLQLCLRHYAANQQLQLGLHYGLEYFTNEEIRLFAQRIIYILKQLPDALNTNINSISILPDAEKNIINSFNNTSQLTITTGTIIAAFNEQAKKTPDLIAAVYSNHQITYGELDKKSNQLAYYLIEKGITRETLVPVCLERGLEMLTAILGILKAGGAYVPIDPQHPEERIQYILDDTKAKVVLTTAKCRSKIPNDLLVETILMDEEWSAIEGSDSKDLPIVTGDNLAYVIYTSGSTGKPKGVMVEHNSYMNLNNSYYKIETGEQSIITCTFIFDVSVLEIFSTLLGGGCLNIPGNSITADPTLYAEFIYSNKISTAYIHPMYLEEVASSLDKYEHCYLTRILVGVEPIIPEVLQWYIDKNITITNGYGPTETTVCATFYTLDNNVTQHCTLPIGKPIANYTAFVVGNNNKLAPIGVPGEIYIGGSGLARGYLNRPELTAEKFVQNPFSKDEKDKLYRTGDMARWLTDGNMQYIGRIDNQVKIRGYRVEPGEIDSCLLQSGLVKQCVVTLKEDKERNKQLIGYVVPVEKFDRQTIVGYLKNKLPLYMVPAVWVALPALPLTTNGKIDRKALPEPDYTELSAKEFVAPRSELELTLATIWKKLLGTNQVSINDNFFDLGGHSLLAVKLIKIIKKETGKSLQVSELVEYSTIEKLSKLIADKRVCLTDKARFLVPIKKGGNNIPLYIICGAGGTALTFYKFAELLSFSQPVYVLQQPTEATDHPKFSIKSIEDIAKKYIEEILVQNPSGPYALSGHCMGGVVAFEMAKQLKAKGKEVKLLALFDSMVPSKETATSTPGSRHSLPNILIKSFKKIFAKIDFELYLLINHPGHAIDYKIISLKKLYKRFLRLQQNNNALDIIKASEQQFKAAILNYKPTKFDGEILAFYAKQHYCFVDKNRNIAYKKVLLENSIKNEWKKYATKVLVQDIEGEHSTIFEPEHAKELSILLQQRLNSATNSTYNVNKTLKVAGAST